MKGKDLAPVTIYFKNTTKYVAKTLKMYIPFDPAIPLLGFYPKEIIRNN